jgi:hypothetical protein
MNATTVPAELPRIRTTSRSPRLVGAELLKLRKRRGLVGATLALTVVPMIVAYIVLVALHVADPAKHGPAGGIENFTGSVNFLGSLTIVAAILVGATAGTGDLGAGVFRELVVTGRSRLALFAARVPAGLGFLLAAVGLALAFTLVASTLLAGSLEGPGAQLVVDSAGWLALQAALCFVIALGVSSLVGSRGTSIGILLGFQLVAMPLLLEFGALGSLREGLVGAAIERLEPTAILGRPPIVSVSAAAAAVAVVAWTLVPLALGAWRTCTRDA